MTPKISTTPNDRAVSFCAARTISAAQLSAVCRCFWSVQPSPGLYTTQTHCAFSHSDCRRQQAAHNKARPTCCTHVYCTTVNLTVRLPLDKNKIYIYVVLWLSPLQSHSILQYNTCHILEIKNIRADILMHINLERQ